MVQAKKLGHIFTAFVCCQAMVLWYYNHDAIMGSFSSNRQSPLTPQELTGTRSFSSNRQSPSTPQELTGSPEKGSILCPSHLYPVYDRIVTTSQQQQQSLASYHHEVRRIPRMIHVSMKSRCLPEDFYENTEKWKSSLPNHSFYFHDDAAVDRLMNLPWPEFPQLKYMMQCVLSSGAMKIDVWRILVVYMFGGIYCDADIGPTKSMTEESPITASDDAFFLSDGWNRPSQWFFAMSPKHPIAYFTMFEIFKRLEELNDITSPKVVFVTGPDALKHGYGRALNWINNTIFDQGTHSCRKELGGNRTVTKLSANNQWVKVLDMGEVVAWNSTLNVTRREKNELLHGVKHWTKVRNERNVTSSACIDYLYLVSNAKDKQID